jgi:hypothetical protein
MRPSVFFFRTGPWCPRRSWVFFFVIFTVFAACKNPWMERIVGFMYEEERSGGTVPFRLYSVTDVAAYIAGYLAAHPGAGTNTDPVPLPLAITLSAENWNGLLDAIADANGGAGVYVALDLAACTRGNYLFGGGLRADGTFDPGTANTGESRIVSLVLPDAAASVVAGTSTIPAFKNFTALSEVNAVAVTGIGNYAFRDCDSLVEVSFPAAKTIGNYAFEGCEHLVEASFPAATSTGRVAFQGCTSLVKASFPLATSILDGAFQSCTSLVEVFFPQATSIGGGASFWDCTSLVEASFPKVTSIDQYTFIGCIALKTIHLPAVTFIGFRVFGYTGTQALTVILGNTVPGLSNGMFLEVTAAKIVTVKVPSGASGYADALPAAFTGTDATPNWGNAFRGGGWNQNTNTYIGGAVNDNIDLTIEALP